MDDVLTIKELGPWPNRTLFLSQRARSIPHSLPTNIRQREQKTFYPGHSEASVQALGPSYEDLNLEGRFDDKYMAAYRPDGAANQVLQTPVTAIETKKLIESFVATARLCELAWSDVLLRGCLIEASFTIQAESKLEYKLKFSVHSTGDLPAPPPTRTKALPLVVVEMEAEVRRLPLVTPGAQWSKDVLREVAKVEGLIDSGILGPLKDANNLVYGTITNLRSAADNVLGSVDSVLESARKLAGVTGQVRSACVALLEQSRQIEYDATSAAVNGDVIALFGFAEARYSMSSTARNLLLLADDATDALEPLLPEWTVHRVVKGQTLQEIARIYWGASDGWQDLADDNDLDTTSLFAGQLLMVRAESTGRRGPFTRSQ
jgi:hypothetical protein